MAPPPQLPLCSSALSCAHLPTRQPGERSWKTAGLQQASWRSWSGTPESVIPKGVSAHTHLKPAIRVPRNWTATSFCSLKVKQPLFLKNFLFYFIVDMKLCLKQMNDMKHVLLSKEAHNISSSKT